MVDESMGALIDRVSRLRLGRFRFGLRAEKESQLPTYKGSTLRGAFGHSLKRLVCIRRDLNCEICLVRPSCAYTHLFETLPPEGVAAFRGQQYAPRPFVLEPSLGGKQFYQAGEPLWFDLTLIGRAIDYLPYVIFAVHQAGQKGLGWERGRFALDSVFWRAADGEERLIYSGAEQRMVSGPFDLGVEQIIDQRRLRLGSEVVQSDRLKLRFQTPTRIRVQGDLQGGVPFELLMRNLLRRLWQLVLVHGSGELPLDHRALIERAKAVELVSSDLGWLDWERYSSRQKTKMRLGGFVGEVEYGFADGAEAAEFLPLLILGEVLHIGASTTFGLGKYEIRNST